jgi:hypothetical protein
LVAIPLLGMLLGMGLATLFFSSRGMLRQEVGTSELESAMFARATRDILAQQLAALQATIAGHRCPDKMWEDEQKDVLAARQALGKATERAAYARGRLDGLAHPTSLTVPEPTAYHTKRVAGIVSKMVQDEKSFLPRGAVDQARSELLRVAVQQGHVCK